MLRSLKVSNLAVVEKAEALFAPGLNVITGETGAGKSVLMGALELVLGGRAEASVVRDGAAEAEVEATFDGHVIRRTVTANGRSRAWIDEESVSVAELKEVCGGLVDIHGPRANQRLLDEDFQREALDSFGGVDETRYAAAYAELRDIDAQIAELSKGGGEDELDLLRYQVGELEEAGLSESDDTLAERHAAAAHAEEVVSAAREVTEALGGDDSAADILVRLHPRFATMAKHLPEAAEWASEAEDLTVRIQELSRTIDKAVSRMNGGAENLDELDARLTLVNRLSRKYLKGAMGPSCAERLLELLQKKRSRLDDLANREERLAKLTQARAETEGRVIAEAKALTERRTGVAGGLATSVTRELRDLGFLRAKFAITVEPCEPTPHGCDRIVYMFEPNPGEAARPLASIASSGEIARVMLALKTELAAHDKTELIVFDEIDANIGGEVGKAVGEKLRKVAKRRQVIAITHLPQSAVFGDRHLVVAKSVSGGRTRTTISTVDGEARVSEIARMLGGEKLTSVVKRHAEEMLELSR